MSSSSSSVASSSSSVVPSSSRVSSSSSRVSSSSYSIALSSRTTSSASTPSASCVAQGLSTYTAQEDGSEFLVLCNQGFQDLFLPGSPIQLLNNNFQACTEQCAAAGTSCAGAAFGTFGGSRQQCYLYSKMLSTDAPAYPIVAAVRTSSSDGALSRRQILQNGGFDGTLTPWTSGQAASGSNFTVDSNTALVRLSLATRAANTGADVEDSIRLQQQISDPVEANTAYFTSLDITVEPVQASGNQVSCFITLRSAEGDTYVSRTLGDTAGPRTVYGSGTVQESGIQVMLINALCTGSRDVVVRFDNVAFSAFEPDGSGQGCDTSLLTNGNFDSELPPWTTSQADTSKSASWSVSGGQAIVRWAANTGMNDAPANLAQSIAMPANQLYRITAQLVFTIASGSCSVGFGTEIETLYFVGQIDRTQTLPVTFDGTSEIQASRSIISITCYSPTGGINSVGIDSVALVMNPGAECPAAG